MVILDVVELMRLVMCVHAEKLTFVVPKRHYGKDVLLVFISGKDCEVKYFWVGDIDGFGNVS